MSRLDEIRARAIDQEEMYKHALAMFDAERIRATTAEAECARLKQKLADAVGDMCGDCMKCTHWDMEEFEEPCATCRMSSLGQERDTLNWKWRGDAAEEDA